MEYLFILLAVVVVFSIVIPKKKIKYKSPWSKPKNDSVIGVYQTKKSKPLSYTKDSQLTVALNSKYEKQRILNTPEEEVYKIVLRMIYQHAKGQFKINMQTSLGEILKCEGKGYDAIKCKRVDFCIVNKEFMPVAVIEVNGGGHYQGDALLRDETKRTAIESAGIKYIAVRENENPAEKLNRELNSIFNFPMEKTIA